MGSFLPGGGSAAQVIRRHFNKCIPTTEDGEGTLGDSVIYEDAINGNIGIGTFPGSLLHVQAPGQAKLTVEATTGDAQIDFRSSGAGGAAIGGGGTESFINRVTDDYGAVGGGLKNQAGDNTGTTADKSFATVGGDFGSRVDGVLHRGRRAEQPSRRPGALAYASGDRPRERPADC